jgi:metallophosphoesterase superfamily enzyme
MQVALNDDLVMDSRRALWMPKARTLVLADFFLGLGASRRKKVEVMPSPTQFDLWERVFALLNEYRPEQVAVLGDLKPNQGNVEGDESEELLLAFRKLAKGGGKVVQVAGHPERLEGPVMRNSGVRVVETVKVGAYTLMHRRRMFIYPRHDDPKGFWINGGLHPLFALPSRAPDGGESWMRLPAFLHTGYALVMPPFVPYAQGHEVMQPERLPKQARAWSLLGDRLAPLDLPNLPPPPDHLRTITRPGRKKEGGDD